MAETQEERAPKPSAPQSSGIAALAGIGRGVTIPFSLSQALEIVYEERWREKEARSRDDKGSGERQ